MFKVIAHKDANTAGTLMRKERNKNRAVAAAETVVRGNPALVVDVLKDGVVVWTNREDRVERSGMGYKITRLEIRRNDGKVFEAHYADDGSVVVHEGEPMKGTKCVYHGNVILGLGEELIHAFLRLRII